MIKIQELGVDGKPYIIRYFPQERDSLAIFTADEEASYLIYEYNSKKLTDTEYKLFINYFEKLNKCLFEDKITSSIWFWDPLNSNLLMANYTSTVIARGKIFYKNKFMNSDFGISGQVILENVQVLDNQKAMLVFIKNEASFEMEVRFDEDEGYWKSN